MASRAFASWVVACVAGRPRSQVTAGPWVLRETHRELTGQQRSSRVVFADRGRKLAVMCPRYNKVLLYTRDCKRPPSSPPRRSRVEGRPVAIASAGGSRPDPPAPAWRRQAPGTRAGGRPSTSTASKCGARVPAGYYPDDMAVTPDGRFLLVLSSGRAEGDAQEAPSRARRYRTSSEGTRPSPIGRLDLEPSDDADRLVVSASGDRGLITLPKAKQAVAIDLSRPEAPIVAGRSELPAADAPYVSRSRRMATGSSCRPSRSHEAVPLEPRPSDRPRPRRVLPSAISSTPVPSSRLWSSPRSLPDSPLGQFPLKGPLNLGGTRPSGLAFCPERGLLAVATKPGTVHLIEIRSRLASPSPGCGPSTRGISGRQGIEEISGSNLSRFGAAHREISGRICYPDSYGCC